MIKVILGIFGVAHLKPFPSAVGFTLRKFDGTKQLITSANGKTRKQKLTYSQMMRQMSLLFYWASIFIVIRCGWHIRYRYGWHK
jgi:hypothetical protein